MNKNLCNCDVAIGYTCVSCAMRRINSLLTKDRRKYRAVIYSSAFPSGSHSTVFTYNKDRACFIATSIIKQNSSIQSLISSGKKPKVKLVLVS